ncbi:MAG TPA: PhoU domain-containing protein [Ktedonobacterales bacterium]|jgi:hypothetical protein|nr:PhoU domain-containing protein [Ktedonobacterales bacterium]
MLPHINHPRAIGDEIARLADEVTELAFLAMDAFKYAAEALFGRQPEVARFALDATTSSTGIAWDVHQKAVGILAHWSPTGEALARIVELQRTSAEYAGIAASSRHVAEQAMVLPAGAEQILAYIDQTACRTLTSLVHQVYIALRGCLILMTTSDRGLARRIIAEDAELERLYTALVASLDQVIGRQPQRAQPLRDLMLALDALRHIGACVVAICEDRLS